LRVSLAVEALPESMPWEISLAAYRIVQEALRNVHKHSGASAAKVFINATSTTLLIGIHDDGCGFNPKTRHHKLGLGLIGVRERARLVGGRLWITSAPGNGTRLSAVLPVKDGAHHEAA
jgi:signal transduction histidine kinase